MATILMLMPPDGAHSVWWFWQEGFQGWYINLEQPVARWSDGELAGVDTVDHDLDVVVDPEGSWRYKDEQELEERSGLPEHYRVPDSAAVWAEARRVTSLVGRRAFPFDGTWRDFRPDPAWMLPSELPAGWDRPRAC